MAHQNDKTSQDAAGAAHPGLRESFARIEELARRVMRERGLPDEVIEAELSRAVRQHEDAGPDTAQDRVIRRRPRGVL